MKRQTPNKGKAKVIEAIIETFDDLGITPTAERFETWIEACRKDAEDGERGAGAALDFLNSCAEHGCDGRYVFQFSDGNCFAFEANQYAGKHGYRFITCSEMLWVIQLPLRPNSSEFKKWCEELRSTLHKLTLSFKSGPKRSSGGRPKGAKNKTLIAGLTPVLAPGTNKPLVLMTDGKRTYACSPPGSPLPVQQEMTSI